MRILSSHGKFLEGDAFGHIFIAFQRLYHDLFFDWADLFFRSGSVRKNKSTNQKNKSRPRP